MRIPVQGQLAITIAVSCLLAGCANVSAVLSEEPDGDDRQPLEIGKAWTVTIPADAKNETRKIVHTNRLLKIMTLKGREVAEIQISALETSDDHPASAYGKVWIDLKTGNTIKYQVDVKNMPVGPQYINAKVLIEIE